MEDVTKGLLAGRDHYEDIQLSSWPSSCCHPETRRIFSVVCCENRYHWAIHEFREGSDREEGGNRNSSAVMLFWKTTSLDRLEDGEVSNFNLAKFLPERAFVAIGGPEFKDKDLHTVPHMLQMITARRIPYFEVYVVSNSTEHATGIRKLFATLPCRIVQLQSKDFFTENGGMEVDRCACLYAATYRHDDGPCLVLDAGSIMSYTCTDADKKLIGGGIMPGLGAKFRSVRDASGGTLPLIENDELKKIIDTLTQENKPLPTFATSTREALLVGVLRETAIHLASLVRSWVASATSQDKENKKMGDDDDKACKLRIYLTGGDSWIVQKLLQERFSNLLDDDDGTLSLKEGNDFEIVLQKNLSNIAVGDLLNEKAVPLADLSQLEKMRHELLGQRVAINGQVGGILVRGTVYDIVRGATLELDFFKVKNDDGTAALLRPSLLYASLMEFSTVGEDPLYGDAESEERQAIRENAKQAATALAEQFPAVLIQEETAVVITSTNKRPTRPETSEPSDPAKKKARSDSAPPAARGRKSSASTAVSASTTAGKKPFMSITKKNIQNDPKGCVNRRVAKMFGDDLYFGTVKSYDNKFWHIEYDDGDNEDYDAKEMVMHLKEYELRESEDKGKKKGRS